MASLEALLKSHSMKKAAVSKLRKQIENKLKMAVSKKRRSSSGLVALEKKKEDLTRAKDHAIQLLNQHLSQKASIDRLKIAAENRLQQEQDAKDQATQQSDYGSEDKNAVAERLQYIDEKISELHLELKERESVGTRLEKAIDSSEKEKTKIEDQLKKQVHLKPALVEQLKSSTHEESVLRPKFESLLKLEAQASNALSVVQKKLAELAALRRKKLAAIAAEKRKRMAALAAQKRKNKARQMALARARKAKARKAKRKPARKAKSRSKKAPKRKVAKTSKKRTRTAKRKTVKRKASKKKPRRR